MRKKRDEARLNELEWQTKPLNRLIYLRAYNPLFIYGFNSPLQRVGYINQQLSALHTTRFTHFDI